MLHDLDAMIAQIEAALLASGLSEAKFGLLAAANARAVQRIRDGTASIATLRAVLLFVRTRTGSAPGLAPPATPMTGRPLSRDEALEDLLSMLAGGGSVAQDTLAARWRVGKGAISKWLDRWYAAGAIKRVTVGRKKMIFPV